MWFFLTEDPFWPEEAYAESINISDTCYISRNLELSKMLTILLSLFFDKNAKYLDYAGGYGVFIRMMSDLGFDFYWYDKFKTNLFAKGFEYQNEKYEAVTTFESFEHFVGPMKEIENLLKISFYAKFLLKFSKFRLHKLLQKQLKSKTWEDHLKMSKL